jgi:predicted RNase H-like nuclease (RuvC/YqgF family)
MRENKPLIVGIDPGTTTGVAAFDLEGKLIFLKSGKNLSKSDISKIISDVGNPIIVSSDINPIPRSVERIATSFSARLIEPGETFSRKEKHDSAREYIEARGRVWANRHERDALVSGIYAYKQVRQMVERMDSRMRKAGISDKAVRNKIRTDVLLYRRSIDSVIKRYS